MSQAALVYAATHAWCSPIRVGSHHFAEYLSRRNRVLYLSHPVSIGSLLSRKDNQLAQRWQLARRGPREVHTAAGGAMLEATCVMPFALSNVFPLNTQLCHTAGHHLSWPAARKLTAQAGFDRPEALWLDTIFQPYWADLLNPRRLCVRVADHPEHISNINGALRRSFTATLDRASLIVTPTPRNAEFLSSLTRSEVRVVANGVDVAHFRQPSPMPPEYQGDSGQRVVFVGALADWLDVGLMRRLADLCPAVTFYLIGPNHNQNLQNLPANLRYLGSRPYGQIPAYLQHAHAALAPFDVAGQRPFIESVDAIKLYEYLAARLPVVATAWQQSELLQPYVTIADQSAEAFADALVELFSVAPHSGAPDAYVAQFSWQQRLAGLD